MHFHANLNSEPRTREMMSKVQKKKAINVSYILKTSRSQIVKESNPTPLYSYKDQDCERQYPLYNQKV